MVPSISSDKYELGLWDSGPKCYRGHCHRSIGSSLSSQVGAQRILRNYYGMEDHNAKYSYLIGAPHRRECCLLFRDTYGIQGVCDDGSDFLLDFNESVPFQNLNPGNFPRGHVKRWESTL